MHSLAIPLLALLAVGQDQISVTNLEAGTVVRNPLVVLEGTAKSGDTIAIGGDWKNAARFPVVEGKWQGFAELKKGKNMIVLQAGRHTMKYLLEYKPMQTPYKVVTLFVQASDDGEKYYTNHLNDKFPIREKLDVAMKLLQGAAAESMDRAGYGRKTFNLEFDKDGKVKVHFFRLPKTAAEMRAMKDVDAWQYMYGEIAKKFPEETDRWCGMLAWTRYDHVTGKTEGHMALGGGAQAMFGGASMGWWPATMKEVPVKFADTYAIDPNMMFEDSAGRRTVWANVSTAYGAMLHEMGHAFGLPHSSDRYSVMSRGFDHFNRLFTAIEPPTRSESKSKTFPADQRMRWDAFSAARLNWNPWFQPDASLAPRVAGPKIEIAGEEVSISSDAGLRLWGLDRDDTQAVFEEFKDRPRHLLKFSRTELFKKLGTDKELRITAIDIHGRQTVADLKP